MFISWNNSRHCIVIKSPASGDFTIPKRQKKRGERNQKNPTSLESTDITNKLSQQTICQWTSLGGVFFPPYLRDTVFLLFLNLCKSRKKANSTLILQCCYPWRFLPCWRTYPSCTGIAVVCVAPLSKMRPVDLPLAKLAKTAKENIVIFTLGKKYCHIIRSITRNEDPDVFLIGSTTGFAIFQRKSSFYKVHHLIDGMAFNFYLWTNLSFGHNKGETSSQDYAASSKYIQFI